MKNPIAELLEKFKKETNQMADSTAERILVNSLEKFAESLPVLAALMAGRKVKVTVTFDLDVEG